MDLVIDQPDSFRKAVERWKKMVPAIMKFSESFSGKFSETLKAIRDDHQGIYACFHTTMDHLFRWFRPIWALQHSAVCFHC